MNVQQKECLEKTGGILSSPDTPLAIIKGYAGTGKSTMIAAIDKMAKSEGYKVKYLAPTNSAALNLYDRIGLPCSTIHNAIYTPVQKDDRIEFQAKVAQKGENVLWVIDEASMIPNKSRVSGNFVTPTTVLNDLIVHAQKHSENCKMIFVGDSLQLPPVGESQSDGLSADVLTSLWPGNPKVISSHLTQIMRQKEESPIQEMTRECIELIGQNSSYSARDSGRACGLPHEWDTSRAITSIAIGATDCPAIQAVAIAFSNRETQFLNNAVRQVMDRPSDQLVAGDHLVAHQACFVEGQLIPKGTRMIITEADDLVQNWGGCRFQNAQFVSDLGDEPMEAKFNLSVLFALKGDIGRDAEKKLKEEAMRTNPEYRQFQSNAYDEQMNAIRPQFGYAMTAHKAQGREFESVFIKPIWSRQNTDFANWQWFYTALTRAKTSVSTISFFLN